MMQLTTQPKETVQDAEQRLWSLYLLAVSRCHGIEVKYHNVWREHVEDQNVVGGAYTRWRWLSHEWKFARRDADEAFAAWKRVAYPLHGFAVDEDEPSS